MRKELHNPPEVELNNITAATECTGLIPAVVGTTDEAEAYANLLVVHPPLPTRKEPGP